MSGLLALLNHEILGPIIGGIVGLVIGLMIFKPWVSRW